MKKLSLIITILITGYAYKVETSVKPIPFIEAYKLDTTKIKFDGFYNELSSVKDSNYIFRKILILNKDKFNYIESGISVGKEPLKCDFYDQIVNWRKLHNQNYLGKYTIKNDSIYAYSPTSIAVGAGRIATVNCNYRGFVKNRDTITGWKVIPPYPKDFTKSVKERNKDLFEPHILYFVKTDAVKCLKMD